MDNIVREGEQLLENQDDNQGNERGSAQNDFQDNQQNQQTERIQQEQQGGGVMKNFEQNAGVTYVNQGTSGPLNRKPLSQANQTQKSTGS